MPKKVRHPGSLLSGGEESDSDNNEQTDDLREVLNVVTQKTRFALIQTIIAHPKGMPSLKEIDYANPSKSKSTIRNHLEKLVDYGVVETVELPDEERSRDLPYRFYRLTDSGHDLLDDHDLLRAEGTLKEMYSMLDTEPLQRYVEAPRPGESVDEESEESSETLPTP